MTRKFVCTIVSAVAKLLPIGKLREWGLDHFPQPSIDSHSPQYFFTAKNLLYRACMRFDILVQLEMWAVGIASTAVFIVFVYVVARREIKHLLRKVR